ncbi:MAG: hypothetical protein AB7P76_12905 [Candidatus Melainabacteria bacterium]
MAILWSTWVPAMAGYDDKPFPMPSEIRVDEIPGYLRFRMPAGSSMYVLLQNPIDTAVNQPGDPIQAVLMQSLYMGDREVLSRETVLHGVITAVVPPMQGRNASVSLMFQEMELAGGERLPIEAHIKSETGHSMWGGEMTPGTKWRTVRHDVWAIGAYKQTLLGGPRQMGMHKTIRPGELWNVVLDQPLTIIRPTDNW